MQFFSSTPLQLKQPQPKWQSLSLLLAGIVPLLFATAATAATFKVNYSGVVTGENDFVLAPFEFLPSDELEELTALRPPEEKTTIEGSYTFDDLTNKVISAQYQLISPTQTTSRSFIPAEPMSAEEEERLRSIGDFRGTFSSASATAARYGEELEDLSSFSSSSVSVDSQSFSYSASFSGIGDGNGMSKTVGVIERFGLEGEEPSDKKTPEEPTTVPEPQLWLGLFLLAGACLARGQKEQKRLSR